jgi:hypothetical protein
MATEPVKNGGPCRLCGSPLSTVVTDLGMSPPCQRFLTADQLNVAEDFYPLVVWVCEQCWLVQLNDYLAPEDIFVEYGYFSSYSDAWLAHCRSDAEHQIERWGLGGDSLVVEVASNDGYFLRWFHEVGVPVLGIEPAKNVALEAIAAGIPTMTEFFGAAVAHELVEAGRQADFLAGKNVLAQVPDLNDFVEGLKILLAPNGVITIEFPHLVQLIENNQFDTIYHEHFSYFSLHTTERLFAAHGLRLFDVDEVPTHGGSLRVYGCHAEDETKPTTAAVVELREREIAGGYASMEAYQRFDEQVKATKRALLSTLIELKSAGKSIAAYGAAGKGMTLLNYCGIRSDFVDFVADRNPYKHGRFCPGVHVPVLDADQIEHRRPDVVLILPWNLREEISAQLNGIAEWGGQFLVPIPTAELFDAVPL